MQGSILNVAGPGGQGLILGEDGTRYNYTTLGWRDSSVNAFPGMKVDFEVRGNHAVGVFPLLGQPPPPPAPPVPPTPVVGARYPSQPTAGGPSPVPPSAMPQAYPNQPSGPTPTVPASPVYSPPPAQPPQGAPPYPYGAPPYPYQEGPGAAAYYHPAKQGSVVAVVGWIFGMDILFGFISAILSIIPVIGWIIAFVLQFVPGFIGGRKAGGVQQAMLAAGILTAIYTVLSFIIIFAVIEALKSIPIFGDLVGGLLNFVGGSVFAFAVVLVIIDAIPMFIGALIGSATKK